jgi:Rab3 GTPase-activating protein catalytic subunit
MSTPRPDLLAGGADKVEGVDNMYIVTKELSSDSQEYRLEFYFQATSEDIREEWKDGLHPLQIWFNVTDFLVISPLNIADGVDPSEASLLLSTVAVALTNCGSQLPAFVPVHESKRKAYQGILGTKTYSARFEADRITSWVPVRFMHLQGLYDLFVSKLAFRTVTDLSAPSVNVEFTMRLTYHTPAPKAPSDIVVEVEGKQAAGKSWDASCPWAEWHSLEDPVKGFELVATWRRRTVTSSSEMEEHENASTLEADKWLLSLVNTPKEKIREKEESVGFAGRLPSLVLAFHVASEANVVEDFAAADQAYIQHITQSLDLPDPVEVDRVLKDIFQEDQRTTECGEMTQDYAHGVKGSPPDSLFSRFCLHALQFGGCNIRAISILWIEFVREVRQFWDEGDRLPRMAVDAPPDPATCLIHQKLQLLQLCIKQNTGKKAVEDAASATEPQKEQTHSVKVDEIVEEAKHLHIEPDSEEDHSPDDVSSEENWQDTTDEQLEMDSVFSPQDVARKSSGNSIKIKNRSSTPRKLQEPSIKEESVNNEPERESVESEIKAANPEASLEEFVPSQNTEHRVDQSENTAGTSGRVEMADLSSEPGMWWRRMWDSKAIGSKQPPFDHIREAEKVMHYLDTIRPQELVAQMLAASFLLVADGLKKSVSEYMVTPFLAAQLEEVYDSTASLLPSLYMPKNEGGQHPDIHIDLLHLCSTFERVEEDILLAVSLGQKLKGAPTLLAEFLDAYIGRKAGTAPRLEVQGVTPRRWKEGGATEREVVAALFPGLGPTQSWRRSLRMGNFLNGHEPVKREIIFSSCYDLMDHYRDGSRRQRVSTQNSYTHRMYLLGTSSDLQVALAVISTD